jgi:hypothetical protein
MSDPSQIHLPIHQALTSDMMLGLKPSAPKSRSYRLSVAPINKSTFQGGDQMIFELPTGRRGTWLDQSQTYLKFSFQCVTTAASGQSITTAVSTAVYLDNTAYSLIQRCDIYNSSNLLETINEYGQLANLLIDTSLTQSDKAGLSSMIGSSNFNGIINAKATATAFAQYEASTQIQTAGDRNGLQIATNTAIATAPLYSFALPLLSGVVGTLSNKMLPVGKLSSPVRLEFYLANNNDAIYFGSAGAGAVWTLSNVEICACYVEILDDTFNHVLTDNQEEYICSSTFRQASTFLPAATGGDFTTLLPFRAASITALYARFRNQLSAVQGANATAAYRKSSSVCPNLSSYFFRVGSSIYPNRPVQLIGSTSGSGSEGYAELLKSFHALSSSIGNSAITFEQYNVCNTPPTTNGWLQAWVPVGQNAGKGTSNNAFAIGLECQSFSNRNDTILSGISTLNSQIYFTGTIYSGATAGGAAAIDMTAEFFAQMDVIYVIDQNGVMSAKF